jgi:hypothetical protein
MIVVLIGTNVTSSVGAEANFVVSGDQARMVERFQTFEVPERLKIYNYLYEKSGHPRDTRLASGFKDKPGETLGQITSDLKPGDFSRFLRYLPVIHSISSARGYDICRAREFPVLKARMRSYRLNRPQKLALRSIQFKGCSLL